jgi:hypothetical protein
MSQEANSPGSLLLEPRQVPNRAGEALAASAVPDDLPAILAAIAGHLDDELRWVALATWLWDNGRE